jgi:HNH endonuclease
MKRESITPNMKVASLLYHNDIVCPLCDAPLMASDKIEWDHFHALALGGAHDYTNIEAVHAECHRRKTFGAAATTAGADINKIAKTRRIRKGKMKVKKRSYGTARPKKRRPWAKRPFRMPE